MLNLLTARPPSECGGGFAIASGDRFKQARTENDRNILPHTSRLEAYCPPERKSKNILFTPR